MRQLVQPGGFYVCDRGYVDYDLFAEWHALPCSFIVRVQHHAAYEVAQERPLSAAARAAGVTRDVVLQRLGTARHRPCAAQPLRVVRVTTDKRHKDGTPVELNQTTEDSYTSSLPVATRSVRPERSVAQSKARSRL
jgi:hypothetical protein